MPLPKFNPAWADLKLLRLALPVSVKPPLPAIIDDSKIFKPCPDPSPEIDE